jgi:dipeptidyl aminopeptidase/acylaminoacyl peptidase
MARIECPILLMFGDRDAEHPTELAVRKWREGLSRAGNDDLTLMVFPGAGHGIRMREGYTGTDRAPFADGYAEAMLGWLWLHVVVP